MVDAVMDPLFYFFPKLDTDYLWLFPKRQEIHKELDIFLDMVRKIVIKKKETLLKNKRLKALAISNGEAVEQSDGVSEKDILTLLIESADEEENQGISIASNDMLLV